MVLVGGEERVAGNDDGFDGAVGGRDHRFVVGVWGGGVAAPGADFAVGGAAVLVFAGEGEGEDGGGVAFEGGDEAVAGDGKGV